MLSIILPVLNEGENLKILIPKLHQILKNKKHEIIVVDDNSKDKTEKIIQTLKKKISIHYILRKNKTGLSSAVIDGFLKAKGNIFLVMDSDLSHPPELITKMLKKIAHYDMIVASRYVEGGGVIQWAFIRKFVSNFATLLTKPLVKIKDPLAGYFALKKQVIHNVPLNPIGFKILLEILVKGHYNKIMEIPYTFLERQAGQSKANFNIYLQYNFQLIQLYFFKLKQYIKRFIQP